MATITVNQYNDDGTTTRTAAETLTINGGVFTQRTDTRWHSGAPAGMVGCYGGNTIISATLGGAFRIDATKVRWMAYTGGGGNVPAIGTNITQAGVTSSYLLGVWATITSAPTAVGASMPSTGFIKFREVNGAFVAGALTGIAASAASADRVGWLEVVGQQLANFNIPRLGDFTTRGDWFYLDNTTGTANQNIKIPTNGSTTTYSPGIWIQDGTGGSGTYTWVANKAIITFANHKFVIGSEIDLNFTSGGATDVDHHTYRIWEVTENTFTVNLDGSGIGGNVTIESYDFYTAVFAAGMTTTNFGTDIRSKIVLMGTDGSITIGHNGTTAVGYIPLTGRKTRVPNIFLRQCVSTTRNTNAIPHATVATRPDFTTTNAGYIDMEFTFGDWYLLFSQPYYLKLRHVATHDGINISECASPLELSDGGTGTSAGLALGNLILTSNFAGGEIFSWIGAGYSNAIAQVSVSYCIGQVFSNCRFGTWMYARSVTKYSIYITQSTDIIFQDCNSLNGLFNINTSFNITVKDYDYCDRYVGETNTTTGLYIITITNSCIGIKVDGITFGYKNTIANQHPYNGILSCSASSDIKLRNCGTRSTFLNGGSANNPAYIFADGGNNIDIKVQRCYMQPTRTAAHSSTNSSKNLLFEDTYGDWLDNVTMAGLNAIERGGSGKMIVTPQAAVYGTHFGGAFMSDTWGAMWLALNEPSAETLEYTGKNFSTGSGFTSAGGLSLATAEDWFYCGMQENRLQTTGFVGATPWVIGTNPQYHDYDYQIDAGSGYSGWKQLTTCRLRAGGGTAGTNTFTITNVNESRQPQIGDFVTAQLGTQFVDGCTVTNIVGTTITLSDNILVTLAASLPVFFSNNLNGEVIYPNIGYKLKFKVTAKVTSNTNLISYIQCNTNSTLLAQVNNLYPLDQINLKINGLLSGSDVVIYAAGTTTIRDVVDSVSNYTYSYETPESIDIGVFKAGYIPFYIRSFTLGSTDSSVPVAQIIDRNYI